MILEEEFMPEDFDLDNYDLDDYDDSDEFNDDLEYDEESIEYIHQLTRDKFFKED